MIVTVVLALAIGANEEGHAAEFVVTVFLTLAIRIGFAEEKITGVVAPLADLAIGIDEDGDAARVSVVSVAEGLTRGVDGVDGGNGAPESISRKVLVTVPSAAVTTTRRSALRYSVVWTRPRGSVCLMGRLRAP